MTSPQDEQTIRAGYAAYAKGDVDALLGLFSPDLVWTYLDAIEPDPKPLICRGLVDLERALRRQSAAGLKLIIEELVVHGDKVAITIYAPGLDRLRARPNDDRNYEVLTVSDGHIIAMTACRNRDEAMHRAGLE